MPEQAPDQTIGTVHNPTTTMMGRYRVIDRLGAGGMGVVFRAHDEKLERTVAIKMLAPGILSDDARRHFRHEALALARLNHARIAAVYDAGEEQGSDYIVMELVQGESLATKLRPGPLPLKEATTFVLQIAEALDEAHEQGIIHRDLKPANVMVTLKGNAKVLDFGIAKLLNADRDLTQSIHGTNGLVGTPRYMAPEQAQGGKVDARTDLWSLGVLFYEALTGKTPFEGDSIFAILRSVTEDPSPSLRTLNPQLPAEASAIIHRALQKDPALRYQSAAEFIADAQALLDHLNGVTPADAKRTRTLRFITAASIALLLIVIAAGSWLYRRSAERQWAREQAGPEIDALIEARKPLAAFYLLQRAERDLPNDPAIKELAVTLTRKVEITSDPPGAKVEIQDYLDGNSPWYTVGTTPVAPVRIPIGYFRWRVSKPGTGELITAPSTDSSMDFSLASALKAPAGMGYAPAISGFETYASFIAWVGPYDMPPFYVDKHEVTNREYQAFVDAGGYQKPQYWPAQFSQAGKVLTFAEAMPQLRDTTGRPGPSTWAGGHFADGQADLPVTGVSWFEASAYASFMGKSLPVLAQWFETAPPDLAPLAVLAGNMNATGLKPVGASRQLGPYGTDDTAGNAREWLANVVDGDQRFLLGGSYKSAAYLYNDPEALSPFDRSDTNGFRCVSNLAPVPAAASAPIVRVVRDFAAYKPVSDEVFNAYKILYDYPQTPLNAKEEGIIHETADWKEEKISFDAAYGGQRMSAYLFVPKRARPPYQTVLFLPSARVMFLPPDSSKLGDIPFFDYIVQSGRAVIYPIYQGMYERQRNLRLPGGDDDKEVVDWYKDASRSLDYLKTRKDIDSSRLAYLGVSMGAADGVILSELLQDRLKAVVLLDGGYFLEQTARGIDQADFAPRLKLPTLLVNGKYDYTFPVAQAQNPLFNMLGTPPAEKSHVLLDTPHDVTERRPQLVKAVLDFLDQYLGRIN